jgi:hypothetical protein
MLNLYIMIVTILNTILYKYFCVIFYKEKMQIKY